jgi:hypothetical protein
MIMFSNIFKMEFHNQLIIIKYIHSRIKKNFINFEQSHK